MMVPSLPAGTESVRPFLPALDFAMCKEYYEALGFAKELDADDVAMFRVGTTSFLLQNHYHAETTDDPAMGASHCVPRRSVWGALARRRGRR